MQKQVLIKRIKALCSPLLPKSFDHSVQLQTLQHIKCVAFDFYGTMFLSGVGDIGVDEEQKTGNHHSFKESLLETPLLINHPSVSEKGLELFRHFIDLHISKKKERGIDYPEPDILAVWQDVLEVLAKQHFVKGEITQDNLYRFAIEFEFRVNTIWPVPRLDEALQKLLGQGFKLGIISNSQFYTPLAFEALMDSSTTAYGFESTLQKWSYQSGYKKPSLQFYRLFANELPAQRLKPGEVLYVGNDLFKDIIPAKKLGMKTALYVGDQRSVRHKAADLKSAKHQPDIILNDLTQLLECLE